MTDHTPDALASALPSNTTVDIGGGKYLRNAEIAAFQAERLADAGYVLVHTAPDDATVERLARVAHQCVSSKWAGCTYCTEQVRAILAALAEGGAQAQHTADDGDVGECTCTSYVVDYSDPDRYHPENLDTELTPGCPEHDPEGVVKP